MSNFSQLTVSNVSAKLADGGKEILHNISISFRSDKTYVVMGPNGSGKSTLAHVMMGNPIYQLVTTKGVTSNIQLNSINIHTISTTDRARHGLFLSFQSPQAVFGVSVVQILRTAYQETHKKTMHLSSFMDTIKTYADFLHISKELLMRSIHDGFSGGERKKIELLQALVLKPKFAIFDEIDTGLDVDALKTIGKGIMKLHKEGTGVILITHYKRLLSYVPVDVVYVLSAGKIVATGDKTLIEQIEQYGYKGLI